MPRVKGNAREADVGLGVDSADVLRGPIGAGAGGDCIGCRGILPQALVYQLITARGAARAGRSRCGDCRARNRPQTAGLLTPPAARLYNADSLR